MKLPPEKAKPLIGVGVIASLALIAAGYVGGLFSNALIGGTADWAFNETFTGLPTSPQRFASPLFDVTIEGSDGSVQAGHAPDCSPPPGTHSITHHADGIFLCRDHMMTTVWDGYSVLTFTPRQPIDFASGTRVIEFEVNCYGHSRNWWDIYIVPEEDMLMQIEIPNQGGDGETLPRRAIRFSYINEKPSIDIINNYAEAGGAGHWQRYREANPNDPCTTSPQTRRLFRLTLSRTSASFSVTKQDGTMWSPLSTTFAALPFTRGLLKFEHHSYNPEKDGIEPRFGTLHWDSLRFDGPVIAPKHAVESSLRFDRRGVNPGETIASMSFDLPALTDARLLGLVDSELLCGDAASVRTNSSHWLQLRINDGPWVDAQFVKTTAASTGCRTFTTINMPWGDRTGQNTLEVKYNVRPGDLTWQHNLIGLRDFEVQGVPSGQVPTPTNTATSTPTATPNPVATPTVTPTPQPTPTPETYRCVRVGDEVVLWEGEARSCP